MRPRALTGAIVIAITLCAATALAGPLPSLYGPARLEQRDISRLTRQLDAGPGPGSPFAWFAEDAWSSLGFHLLGATGPSKCTGTILARDEWQQHLETGSQLARAGRWKAAREELEPHVLEPECVDGPIGDQLHDALIDLARAAWYGYPEDEALARRALDAAIRLEPESSWPNPTEVELEKAYWEQRSSLVPLQRSRLLVVKPEGLVRIDGRLVDGWLELVPGHHVLQIGDTTVSTALLDLEPGAELVLGRPDGLWELLTALSTDEDFEPSEESAFARAALHTRYPSGYWLVADGRAARVRASGGYTWPPRRDRFVAGVALNYRFLEATTNAPVVISTAHTEHWVEPRITVGFRGRPASRGPQLGMQGGASLLLAPPVDVGLTRKYTRLMPAVRAGPTLGMSDHNVRLSGGLYGEIMFAGLQAIQRTDPNNNDETIIELRQAVFVGVVGEVQASLRLSRVLWLTVQGGGGWVASPTLSAGVGLEIRAWHEPR